MQYWQPNQSLKNGRFTIQKILGGGGYGVTYSAIDNNTSKIIAIKTLKPIQQNQPDFEEQQEKFVNEALRLRGCSHPHIVQVYEMIREAGLWGMVMEYIEGQDLAVYVSKRGQLPEDEALRYINQIGQALEYVHQQGFLHRDVKPNNIILRQSTQSVVLIDFGLTREFIIGRTGSMTNAKTEGYAPIEQYERRGNFAPCTDVYALAATLYTLLTAEVPIPANFRKYAQLPPPKQFNSQISDRVNEAILKGMALEPQDRVQTVREWLGLVLPRKVNTPTPQASIPNSKSKIQNQPSQNIATPPKSDDGIKLKTAKTDYTRLRDLLAAEKWRAADEETTRVMLAVARREREGCLDNESIDNFPCEDLRTIDQLWVKYSNGRFGFSVQKRIYQSLGGTKEYNQEIWEAFGDAIGWRKNEGWMHYTDITFDLKAPQGHLPSPHERILWTWLLRSVRLFSRVETCKM
ncbi:serine/threonine-protein kinase [Chlorogloeopsis sp. ULAP01]|uniref:serine/threonine-protein kinase n=1 Tax=Chlorogloeopsis sp. ULAP01 TaxID=3056483 RepID=UPI0025AA5E2F|nr:serine/threonine-protein kinase [Chlorogloeopsis sp. ULAP01]MDM9383399.1 serine/threonine-protein kinase [Chlorogloeopsis sp. ULAP01]